MKVFTKSEMFTENILHIPIKQHNRPEGTACYSASNCMIQLPLVIL